MRPESAITLTIRSEGCAAMAVFTLPADAKEKSAAEDSRMMWLVRWKSHARWIRFSRARHFFIPRMQSSGSSSTAWASAQNTTNEGCFLAASND
jgi:hypothetical protein